MIQVRGTLFTYLSGLATVKAQFGTGAGIRIWPGRMSLLDADLDSNKRPLKSMSFRLLPSEASDALPEGVFTFEFLTIGPTMLDIEAAYASVYDALHLLTSEVVGSVEIVETVVGYGEDVVVDESTGWQGIFATAQITMLDRS